MTTTFPPLFKMPKGNGLDHQHKYTVEIVQTPVSGRMCGLQEVVHKRMLDPPLVLQVKIINSTPQQQQQQQEEQQDAAGQGNAPSNENSYERTTLTIFQKESIGLQLVCTVHLVGSTGGNPDNSILLLPSSINQNGTDSPNMLTNLLGQTCRPACILDDSRREPQLFFIFPDLAVRIQGEFMLSCKIVDLRSGMVTVKTTEKFIVYPPQTYPGVLEPTALSKIFYDQGIAIRSGKYSKKPRHFPTKKEFDDSNDEE